MLEVLICLVSHCVMSLILNYCYDEEKIWNNNEIAPKLRMPKLRDLDKECGIYDQQKYVDKVIIPSHNYFSVISDINTYQDNEPMLQLIAWLPTFLLVANAFRRAKMFPYTWLDIAIGLIVCILVTIIVFVIYNRTRLKLGTFELSVSDIKKDYYSIKESCDWEFDLSDEAALNNFLINKHYNYISCVHNTIEKRYKVKKVVEAITGWIYLLFIMRIPD